MVCICTGDLQKYKEHLKHYYFNMKQSKSSRWPKLADPSLYIDVTIAKAQYSSGIMGKDALELEKFYEHAMDLLDNIIFSIWQINMPWIYNFRDSCHFALKVNFCDKIFVNPPIFHELLVPSTLTSSSTSHEFREEIFVNKNFE